MSTSFFTVTRDTNLPLFQNGRHKFNLEVADTVAARTRGLSGRKQLRPDQGMLFKFEDSGEHCMWMKEMHLSLDMLWLDEKGKILTIKENVAPETYPESFCAYGKYVVEVLAGTIDKTGLKSSDYIAL